MPQDKVLWIDLQPTLHCLNKRVAQLLSRTFSVQRWSFQHDLDESCSVATVHDLLRQTLVASPEPMHLVGHGISGTVACLFAEKYPDLVKSLTLLSVILSQPTTGPLTTWTCGVNCHLQGKPF